MSAIKNSIFPPTTGIPLDAWWTQNGIQIEMDSTFFKIYNGHTNTFIDSAFMTQVDDGKFHDVYNAVGLSIGEYRVEMSVLSVEGTTLEQMDFFQVVPWYDDLIEIKNKTLTLPDIPAAQQRRANAGVTVDTDTQIALIECWLEVDNIIKKDAADCEFTLLDRFDTVLINASTTIIDTEGFFRFGITGVPIITPDIYRGKCIITDVSGLVTETFRTYNTAGGS